MKETEEHYLPIMTSLHELCQERTNEISLKW